MQISFFQNASEKAIEGKNYKTSHFKSRNLKSLEYLTKTIKDGENFP